MSLSVGAGLLVGGEGDNGGGIAGGGGGDDDGGGIPRGGGGSGVAPVSGIRIIHSELVFQTGAGTEDSHGWLRMIQRSSVERSSVERERTHMPRC